MNRFRTTRSRCLPSFGLLIPLVAAGCVSNEPMADPLGTLANPDLSPARHHQAIVQLDERPEEPQTIESLTRLIWVAGYAQQTRREAFDRLEQRDLPGLKRTLRQKLPLMPGNLWSWMEELCERIADRNWVDLTPALVSSWSRPSVHDDLDRPEYKALVRLHGEESVVNEIFDLMLKSSRPSEMGLRTRCWNLLHRLDERQRLIDLLADASIAPDDLFLQDLRDGATDLNVVPHNREEILWLRELRQPEHASFWSQAREAVAALPPHRREELTLRDIPIIVSASLHAPELLAKDRDTLYRELETYLREQKHYSRLQGYRYEDHRRQRLYEYRDDVTWGDLAAMSMAIEALQVPQVVEHLFDYAARDRADRSTEYGGVLCLDDQGRFEVLEFLPRNRLSDERFEAPQAMLDAAYTAQFHFHFHVQRVRNVDFAGPGIGDKTYADNTRANCLVFTSVGEGRMNVDYYRFYGLVVDLGEIVLDAR